MTVQEEDHYERRDATSFSKRSKVEEVGGAAAGPTDPYTAMCMYYSKLNAFRPWSPKSGGLSPLQALQAGRATDGEERGLRVEEDRTGQTNVSPHGKRKHNSEKGQFSCTLKGYVMMGSSILN